MSNVKIFLPINNWETIIFEFKSQIEFLKTNKKIKKDFNIIRRIKNIELIIERIEQQISNNRGIS